MQPQAWTLRPVGYFPGVIACDALNAAVRACMELGEAVAFSLPAQPRAARLRLVRLCALDVRSRRRRADRAPGRRLVRQVVARSSPGELVRVVARLVWCGWCARSRLVTVAGLKPCAPGALAWSTVARSSAAAVGRCRRRRRRRVVCGEVSGRVRTCQGRNPLNGHTK